jgi:Uma2 family endonuclease
MATKPKKPIPVEMTGDEFLLWCLTQEDKYELVDGVPVAMWPAPPSVAAKVAGGSGPSVTGMAGASRRHDRITSNVIGLLFAQLRGSGCWAATSDTALRTKIKRIRRPDVTVECSPADDATYEAQNPVATFEVLSPTTEKTDKQVKLPEYMGHPKLRTIVLIDPKAMSVLVYERDESGDWLGRRLTTPTDEILVAGTSAKLTLANIYEDVLVA